VSIPFWYHPSVSLRSLRSSVFVLVSLRECGPEREGSRLDQPVAG